jgi:hypothetical protein
MAKSLKIITEMVSQKRSKCTINFQLIFAGSLDATFKFSRQKCLGPCRKPEIARATGLPDFYR